MPDPLQAVVFQQRLYEALELRPKLATAKLHHCVRDDREGQGPPRTVECPVDVPLLATLSRRS